MRYFTKHRFNHLLGNFKNDAFRLKMANDSVEMRNSSFFSKQERNFAHLIKLDNQLGQAAGSNIHLAKSLPYSSDNVQMLKMP